MRVTSPMGLASVLRIFFITSEKDDMPLICIDMIVCPCCITVAKITSEELIVPIILFFNCTTKVVRALGRISALAVLKMLNIYIRIKFFIAPPDSKLLLAPL